MVAPADEGDVEAPRDKTDCVVVSLLAVLLRIDCDGCCLFATVAVVDVVCLGDVDPDTVIGLGVNEFRVDFA